MIKRVQRGFIRERISKSTVRIIELDHEINPDKCIVNLKDGIVGSLDEVIVSQSLVMNLTTKTLKLKLPVITNVNPFEKVIGECSWEIIEFE